MDPAAHFVHELTRHQRALCAYIAALTCRLADAEEILQEVNAKLWEQKDKYDAARDFLPWARTVAHYQVLAFRTRMRRQRFDFDDDLIATLAAEAADGHREMEARHSVLERCLEKVESSGRELLDLCYAGGLAIRSVAARLGRSEAGTYKALARLRQKLHECVERGLQGQEAAR